MRSRRGFTLIELMITVAIIGILAAIAVPQYFNYIYRTKRTEALSMLATIKVAQETYRANKDCYVAIATNPPLPATPVRRIWDFSLAPDGPCSDLSARAFENINVRPAGSDMYYSYACVRRWNGTAGETEEFTCSMIGDLDGDGLMPQSEIIYCTDHDADGTCYPSITGAISAFPYDPVRANGNQW